MKISFTMVIVIIMLLCALPLVWAMTIGKTKRSKNKSLIKNLLKADNIQPDREEFWNNKYIGIDTAKGKLVFIKLSEGGNRVSHIGLSEIKACHIHKTVENIKGEKKTISQLQTLRLDLEPNAKKPAISLGLYDVSEQFVEDFEMKRAEKWQQHIHAAIKKGNAETIAA